MNTEQTHGGWGGRGHAPFTPDTAAEAGRKSGAARRRKREQTEAANELERATTEGNVTGTVAALERFAQRYEPGELPTHLQMVATWICGRLLTGDIPVTNGRDAAQLLTATVELSRLMQGEATRHTLSMSADVGQRLDAIRAEASDQPSLPPGGDRLD